MRRIPLNAARQLGKATRMWKGIPLVYIFVTFFLIPIILLGLSVLFTQNVKGLTVVGAMLTTLVLGGICYGIYWWKFAGGAQRCITCMGDRQARSDAVQSLPDDMVSLQAKLKRLEEHTGLLSGDGGDNDVDNDADAEAPSSSSSFSSKSDESEKVVRDESLSVCKVDTL